MSQFEFAQRELKRPLPLALAIAAIVGWIAVAGLGWTLSKQNAEHREEMARTFSSVPCCTSASAIPSRF